jgi:hypothetical protein
MAAVVFSGEFQEYVALKLVTNRDDILIAFANII